MTVIANYLRVDEAKLDAVVQSFGGIMSGEVTVDGLEIIDIDKAYEPLAWLASPLKRAEMEHNAKLMFDEDWPAAEARASVARLNEMEVDDWLAAIEGRSDSSIETIDFGLGGSALFRVEQVHRLAKAMSELNEAYLRQNLDFVKMDEQYVQPGYWQEEGEEGGEDTFQSYVLVGLKRLQNFYRNASENNQIVIVGYS